MIIEYPQLPKHEYFVLEDLNLEDGEIYMLQEDDGWRYCILKCPNHKYICLGNDSTRGQSFRWEEFALSTNRKFKVISKMKVVPE